MVPSSVGERTGPNLHECSFKFDKTSLEYPKTARFVVFLHRTLDKFSDRNQNVVFDRLEFPSKRIEN